MTSILPHSRKPDVSFYSDGRIDITARIAKELNLQQGDVIDVVTSGWKYLLYVRLRAADTDGRHEAQVYRTNPNSKSNNFRAYSRTITDVILEEVCSHTTMRNNGKIARLPAGKAVNLEDYGKAVPIRIHNTL